MQHEAFLVGSRAKSGKKLKKWLSLQLPSAFLFKKSTLSKVCSFSATYQFLISREVIFDENDTELPPLKIAKCFNRGESLRNILQGLRPFSSLTDLQTSTSNFQDTANYDKKEKKNP